MEEPPIPISLVAHTIFCPRRAWLEASGEKVASAQIESGLSVHKRVDSEEPRTHEHLSVEVHDEELGLTGRCDVVRNQNDGALELIEYKATPVRRRAEVTPAHEIQLALQWLCLQRMGHQVDRAGVYFPNHRVTQWVTITNELLDRASGFVEQTRTLVTGQTAPPPLTDDPRCRSCSHAGVCLPEENRGGKATGISASNPDGEMVHVVQPGARVQLHGGRLEVVSEYKETTSLPLERVVGLIVHGNVDVSSAVIREMLWRRNSVVWCSGRGRVTGWATTAESPNGSVRIHQAMMSSTGHLPLASEFVAAKTSNQRTQLRRNATGVPEGIIRELREVAGKSTSATSLPQLFAMEGRAAALYFAHFPKMVRSAGQWALRDWTGRQGRHSADPLNSALNFAYALLLADCIRAVVACGLDPSGGFLHSNSRNKPALALDLMEEFRAPLADSAVLRAVNNGELQESMFVRALGDARMNDAGRRALVQAYEARVTTKIRHPTFGYLLTWRRAIEVQARMVLGYVDGTQTNYRGMRTR